jgi:hypothetical protein
LGDNQGFLKGGVTAYQTASMSILNANFFSAFTVHIYIICMLLHVNGFIDYRCHVEEKKTLELRQHLGIIA